MPREDPESFETSAGQSAIEGITAGQRPGRAGEIQIDPRGPFSFSAARDVLAQFAPLQRHWRGPSEPVRLSFPLDGDFTPVAVALRDAGESLHGEVVGTDRLAAVKRQVARVFSLDVDGRAFQQIAERDPGRVSQ